MIDAPRTVLRRLEQWLRNDALPWWAEEGIDRVHGGFHERFSQHGTPLNEPRRTRVVARQIYVFATALRHGWSSQSQDRIDHGLRFLLNRLRLTNGTYAASYDVSTSTVEERFDLYEQAFALFSLASAFRARPDMAHLPGIAYELWAALKRHVAHPTVGYFSSSLSDARLEANPHMHLLEAALAWEALGPTVMEGPAHTLADELATLALQRLIDPTTGALPEHFDAHWRPLSPRDGQVVEPGHQFEWAWLLFKWATRRSSAHTMAVARTLINIGEGFGVDRSRGVAVNALRADFSIQDKSAKLWPQTERVKAWCAMAEASDSLKLSKTDALERTVAACNGMIAYIDGAPRGRWHEVWHSDGSFSKEPTRASSLYHVVCAIEVLKDMVDSLP